MKKLIITLLAASTLAGYSQTNNTTFFQSVTGYFSSFNTNLDTTFGNSKGQAWTGVDSLQGSEVPLANSLGLSYKLFKGISGETILRDGGVSGGLVNAQAGFGLNIVVHDAQLTVYAHGGYDFIVDQKHDRWYGEIGLRGAKALTEHTFAGVGLGVKVPNNDRLFSVFAGFTF